MKYPNFNEEKKLWRQGYNIIVGIDEAGRGPLAGPVVAGAVFINPKAKILLKGINDSKKLSEKQREDFYKILINNKDVRWGVGIVSEKMIDKINILEATKLAMHKAYKKLAPDFLLVDGNFIVRQAQGKNKIFQKSIIKGDQKVLSISTASIIAKVTRDRLMQKYHKKYPQYGFDKHKGYGTALHIANLKKFGPCKIHRKTFYPVSNLIDKKEKTLKS
jgi:ribonuclease HII